MKLLKRKNVLFLFLIVEAIVIVVPIVFNKPAHFFVPIFIGIAILAVPFVLLTPSNPK
jgi:hypothetical protein